MKTFMLIAGIVVLLFASAMVSLWGSGRAVSQFRGQYQPLYAGIDSPGAVLDEPQDPNPNHFFEGRVDWPLLNIAEPRTAWEYTQRGIYFQDDVGNLDAAMVDYMRADALERERSCIPGAPPPDHACLQILHARLSNLYLESGQFQKAIDELDFILEENPFAQGLHFELAEAHLGKGEMDAAIEAFNAELDIQPCHQATHFELGELLLQRGDEMGGREHLTAYLQQALLHCDSFPFKILKARKLLTDHGGPLEMAGSACPATLKGPVDQVLSIPMSQITARMGCNPPGTRFHEEEQTQTASAAD